MPSPFLARHDEDADRDALRPLPAPSGPPRAVLMLLRPGTLFVYWVVDAALDTTLRDVSAAEIRVDTGTPDGRFTEADRRPFDFRTGSWYLSDTPVDARVRVRLGIVEAGAFRPILTSNTLLVPREAPGTSPVVWAADRAAAGPGVARSSPGSWTWPGTVPQRGAASAHGTGDLCLVLHSHLPFVRHPERERFLEENWLFEAILETYLPILDMLDHLDADGVAAPVTLSLTATLTAMLRDPLLMARFERHLDRSCALAAREVERTRRDPDFGPVAGFYDDRLQRLRALFLRVYRRDLVGRFAELESRGRIEIIASAATHGFLPHLAAEPESVRAQIAVGVREHRRQIGRAPRGLWLPECAWFEGLDGLLAAEGIGHVFLDAHALRRASSRPMRDLQAPLLTPSGVAAFGRDEESSEQVWSSMHGYPGDPSYRDFYRDIGYDLDPKSLSGFLDPSGQPGFTGLKYHRITGRHDDKEPYRRGDAVLTVERHAADFVANRARQAARNAGLGRPLMVAMYDAELFGHWWFEGPEWLEGVLRRLPAAGLRAVTPSGYLAERPVLQKALPAASSWGNGGYYEVWLGGANDWIWPPLHDAARRMKRLALTARGDDPPLRKRALAQMGRELLLAQASDWPFIINQRTSVGYAERRVREHLVRFDDLARQTESGRIDAAWLARLEARDNLFPELDPACWRPA